MLELKNVNKIYKMKKGIENKVLKNISLKFDSVGMTFILGKSGSGKSTLLNIIGGLDKYDSGDISIFGKSTKNFKEKEFDSYRNNYIGFVFQEFNVIEDYTVYENIVLALELQNKKIEQQEIETLLTKLEINNLKHRKINELSGGQKQRVAIARALIKKPKIILADEPTGNLDCETGKQVLNVLKEISKDKLVIIVSHDRESAKQYGDRIIEIKDGKIVSDSKHDTISISGTMDNYKNTKTKLPIKDSLKMALENIFHKKIKLLFTSVITALTFLFLGLSFLLSVYDIRTSHAKVLTDDNSNFIQIENRGYTKEYLTGTLNPLKKEDINSIIEQSKREGVPIYQFQNSTSNIINDLKINLSNDFDDVHDFYTNIFPYMTTEIVELERADQILKESIVGRFPEKENEIVISNYIATLILENGITIYDSNQNDYKIPGIFKPKNFEELLSSDKTFYFGTLEGVKIVGVIDYDMNQFNQLKGIYREAVTSKEMDLNHELNMKSQYIYNKVYVKEGFINFYNKSSDKNLSENYKYELESNNINFYDYKSYYTSYQFLDEDVDYYDGEQWTTIDHLEKDQILLNIHQLSSFNLSTYEELLSKYLSNYENGNKVELEKNFLIQFLPDDLIGKKVNLNIYNQNSSLDQTYKDIEIIGIVGLTEQNQNSSFVSNNFLDNNYKSSKFNTTGVMLSVHTEAEIKSLLKLFPYYSTYTVQSPYNSSILSIIDTINVIKRITMYSSFVFLIFSIILLTNFIFTSVNYRKKDIGILRALGARKIDIIKIFSWESMILTLLSALISSILLFYTSKFLNNTILESSLIISPFMPTIQTVSFIIFAIFIISIIATIISINKISKLKPVDAIYNRK